MSAATCPGCLGDRRCWVCSGTGLSDLPRLSGRCTSCAGSRICAYCAELVIDLTGDGVAVPRQRPAPARQSTTPSTG